MNAFDSADSLTEQQYYGIFFECEKKINDDVPGEFAEALLILAEVLLKSKIDPLTNLIFLRISNAYKNTSNYNRYLIHEFFIKVKDIFQRVLNKDEILKIMTDCLYRNDYISRTITCKVIETFAEFYAERVDVFHQVFHIFEKTNVMVEKKSAYKTVSVLCNYSSELISALLNKITDMLNEGALEATKGRKRLLYYLAKLSIGCKSDAISFDTVFNMIIIFLEYFLNELTRKTQEVSQLFELGQKRDKDMNMIRGLLLSALEVSKKSPPCAEELLVVLQNLLYKGPENELLRAFMNCEQNQKFSLIVLSNLIPYLSDVQCIDTERLLSQWFPNKNLFTPISKVLQGICIKDKIVAGHLHDKIVNNIKSNLYYMLYMSLVEYFPTERAISEYRNFINLVEISILNCDYVDKNSALISKIAKSYSVLSEMKILITFYQSTIERLNNFIKAPTLNRQSDNFNVTKARLWFIELLIIGIPWGDMLKIDEGSILQFLNYVIKSLDNIFGKIILIGKKCATDNSVADAPDVFENIETLIELAKQVFQIVILFYNRISKEIISSVSENLNKVCSSFLTEMKNIYDLRTKFAGFSKRIFKFVYTTARKLITNNLFKEAIPFLNFIKKFAANKIVPTFIDILLILCSLNDITTSYEAKKCEIGEIAADLDIFNINKFNVIYMRLCYKIFENLNDIRQIVEKPIIDAKARSSFIQYLSVANNNLERCLTELEALLEKSVNIDAFSRNTLQVLLEFLKLIFDLISGITFSWESINPKLTKDILKYFTPNNQLFNDGEVRLYYAFLSSINKNKTGEPLKLLALLVDEYLANIGFIIPRFFFKLFGQEPSLKMKLLTEYEQREYKQKGEKCLIINANDGKIITIECELKNCARKKGLILNLESRISKCGERSFGLNQQLLLIKNNKKLKFKSKEGPGRAVFEILLTFPNIGDFSANFKCSLKSKNLNEICVVKEEIIVKAV